MAYQTGLLKARGRRKGQNRFWPVAVEQRQKWAGCNAYVCCLLCSTVSACTRARTPSASWAGQKERLQHLSFCACVCVQQGCITHPLPSPPF